MANKTIRVVVIGGVAAGPKVASRVIRLNPQAEVTLIEKGEFLSYAGCGLPYYVAGVVKEQKELMCTPLGVVRDPVFFHEIKNVKVRNRTEALAIDRKNKKITLKDLMTDSKEEIPYDELVLATGATPFVPPVEGINLGNVFTLHRIEDAEGIKKVLAEEKAKDVVIVGGGLIGLEMTEAIVSKGCRVTIVEKLPHILPILDEEMAMLLSRYLESKGVKVKTGTTLTGIKGREKAETVVTDKGEIPCDMVIMAIGVRPNSRLAKEAGLEIGKFGGICVNECMQTSDEHIYAAGDCVETKDLITGEPVFIPLGSTANKQGRVVANRICGQEDSFPGVIGSTVCKVFEYAVGRTGLTERQARAAGFECMTVLNPAPDRAHYYPDARLLMMKMVVDKKTRRLLGLQAIGPGEVDKRVDVAATAITAKMTVEDIAHLDLCYAPPYSPAMDNIITTADIARNKLDGICEFITPQQVKAKMDNKEDFVFLDVRSQEEFDEVSLSQSILIPLGQLRKKYTELPMDKEIITFCKISLRGYEAALILKGKGFKQVKVMDGGVVMWPYEKNMGK